MVSERYDEVVFSEPTEWFAYVLDKGPANRGAAFGQDEDMKEVDHEHTTDQKEGD